MKIVHITTSIKGGAGRAAFRLHQGLLSLGVDSVFLTLENEALDQKCYSFLPFHKKQFRSIVLSFISWLKIIRPLERRQIKKLRKMPGQYELFSFPETSYRVEKHPLVLNADIVHLHWVSGFINYPTFFKAIKQPIVWTLHDMNPLLGGFHYNEDSRINSNFKQLELACLAVKAEALRWKSNLQVVTPSRWMGEEAKSSDLLSSFPQKTLFNGLDTETYKPLDREKCKTDLNIPLDKKVLLFVAEDLKNRRKGFDHLWGALKLLNDSSSFVLVTIGNASSFDGDGCIHLGMIGDDAQLAKVYAAADLFLLPSREDNLPNVMLEALCCGTPVVSFALGGMKDVIDHGRNGYLAPEVNSSSLGATINEFLTKGVALERDEIASVARRMFALERQATHYLKLYQDLS